MKTLLLTITLFSSLTWAQNNMTLSLGESRQLFLKGQSSVWIQDRDILKAEGQGTVLSIRGLREGSTLLKVGPETFRVQVVHPTKTNSFSELEKELQNIVGLSATIGDGDLLVKGRLYRLQDWERLAEFARIRNLNYQMRAELSDELKDRAQEYFRNLLEKAKVPPQTIIFDPFVEVRISASDLLLKKYQKIFLPYGIQIVRDETSLEIAPTIKVQITVAEIKRSSSLKYGLKWSPEYSASLLPTNRLGVSREGFPISLRALEENGDAKILASPNILCRSGKEAEFLAGGEFPIQVIGFRTAEVVWKRYGILLKVKPKADSSGRISLSIETEVTTLDKATSSGDIPGVLTNRVSSHFDLTRPQTIALSGLLKNEDGKASSGLPLLSRLPVVGALFSSKDFLENRSELVIFVRPTILKEGESGEGQEHLQTQGDKT